MKKTLIAIAALATVGTAAAQSAVTLYGRIDTNYGWSRATTTKANGTKERKTSIGLNPDGKRKGNLSTSRWGLKGQEDIGNGLSAVFNIEAGFNSGTGAFLDGGFARRSVVGLKGSFGQVVLGRDYTPVDSIAGGNYQADGLDLLALGYTRRANGIHYSGKFSGIGVQAFAGTKGNDDGIIQTKVNDVKTTKTAIGLGVSYADGPFAAGVAVQTFNNKVTGSRNNRTTEYAVGASYDFTAAKLYAHYMGIKKTDTKAANQIGIGIEAPVSALTLGAEYAYNWGKTASFVGVVDNANTAFGALANNKDKAKGHNFALQARYAMSKRTDLYARAARYSAIKGSGVTAKSKTNSDLVTVGIRHKF